MDTLQASHLLVLNSILAVIILGGSILFYQYVFPQKKIALLPLLILIGCLPLVSLLRPGTYESGDLSIHIMEEIFFYKVLGQGNFFPHWGGDMNATYGYPSFLFTYPLPFYIMAFFHFIGFSFINSAKLLLASSFLSSGIFMYLWLKREVGEKGAFVGSLFYLFAPYHLVDLHFRSDIGEVLAFVFIPLSLLAASEFVRTKVIKWLLLEVLSLAALIISHPAISLVGFAILSLYIAVLVLQQSHKLKLFVVQIGAFFSALLLTAFYWLPVLYQIRFTYHPQFAQHLDFVEWYELIYSPWRFGLLFQGSYGELSYVIGYAQFLLLITAIVFLIKKKFSGYDKKLAVLSLSLFVLFTFMMLEVSKPLWHIIPFINNFQFSYRLLGVIIFLTAVIAAIVTKYIKSDRIVIFICVLVVLSTLLNWGNRKNLPDTNDLSLAKQIPDTATNGGGINQAITIWSDPENPYAKIIPERHIEIINGKGEIEEITRINTKHVYLVDTKTSLAVRENTLYFPGWKVFIDDNEQKIDILSKTEPKGIMSFHIPPGKHIVQVVFQDTFVVKLGKLISVVSLVIIFCSTWIFFKKNK